MLSFQVDPDQKFAKAVDQAAKEVGDLTVPLTLIAKQWFQSNKAIFSLSGPGKYKDLSPTYKKAKAKKYGTVYPIFGTKDGPLESSITDPSSPNSVNNIVNRTALFVGTRVPYAIYHQSDAPRTKIPFRPMVLIGSEQTAPPALNQRREIWIEMIYKYVADISRKRLGSK